MSADSPGIRLPKDEAELLARAHELSGMTVGKLAEKMGEPMMQSGSVSQRNRKGRVGGRVERYLGVPNHSAAGPDFPELGIEVKTIPLAASGQPTESTYVCAVSFRDAEKAEWATCRARSKLLRVLWVPVQADRTIPVEARRIGVPFLWSPSPDTEVVLRDDWETIIGAIASGSVEEVTAHWGRFLQLRPKAANAAVRAWAPSDGGGLLSHNPRGFYLRPEFTRSVVESSRRPS